MKKPAQKKTAQKIPAARVVEATGTAASEKTSDLGRRVEEAMSAAVVKAQAEGVTKPEEIRKRMLAARDAVKSE